MVLWAILLFCLGIILLSAYYKSIYVQGNENVNVTEYNIYELFLGKIEKNKMNTDENQIGEKGHTVDGK